MLNFQKVKFIEYLHLLCIYTYFQSHKHKVYEFFGQLISMDICTSTCNENGHQILNFPYKDNLNIVFELF